MILSYFIHLFYCFKAFNISQNCQRTLLINITLISKSLKNNEIIHLQFFFRNLTFIPINTPKSLKQIKNNVKPIICKTTRTHKIYKKEIFIELFFYKFDIHLGIRKKI